MGVPTFYRYIHEKFPKAVRDYIEVMPDGLEAATEADWSAEPNPNGIEVDNLYLDFNGIVHNATHPEDRPAPSGFDAMMLEVFRRVDRIVLAARPRRLLYLALDGVAPRAKMNQQRSRRFMAVREASSQRPSALDAAADDGGGKFDHNAITPGTEFMLQLGKCLRYYCAERAARCPAWRRLTVILSDASVPGEGEHKIMEPQAYPLTLTLSPTLTRTLSPALGLALALALALPRRAQDHGVHPAAARSSGVRRRHLPRRLRARRRPGDARPSDARASLRATA